MQRNINQVYFSGEVTSCPETMWSIGGERCKCRFKIDGIKEQVNLWFEGALAHAASRIAKGSVLHIDAKYSTRQYFYKGKTITQYGFYVQEFTEQKGA